MSVIKKLSNELINKIAAGEVVERPASVVKELVENALDAKAANIEVIISDGGKKSILIRDDGVGIGKEDLKLAIERHSTSKISNVDDLFKINTMGFRGEALAAIASVSRLSMASRKKEGQAYLIEVEGGEISGPKETGHPAGTTVTVKNLFYHVPARLKFLKSAETESTHITDFMTKEALAHPEIGFQLTIDGKKLLSTPSTENFTNRVHDIFGKDIASKIYSFSHSRGEFSVSGVVGNPELARSHARDMIFFVNSRPVKDKIIHHAVLEGYRDLLMRGRFPFVILFLELPPQLVDVNVHPAKTEVRFADTQMVHRLVYEGVRNKLSESPWKVESNEKGYSLPEKPSSHFLSENKVSWGASPTQSPAAGTPLNKGGWGGLNSEGLFQNDNQLFLNLKKDIASEEKIYGGEVHHSSVPYSELKIIGQLLGTYIVCEAREKMVLIDQHAAHERVNFEKFLKQYKENGIATQHLLIPENFELKASETDILKKMTDDLKKVGLEIDFFGGNTFVVRSVPVLFSGKIKVKELMADLVGDFLEKGKMTSFDDILHDIIATMACHASIRAHDVLKPDEMKSLLLDLEKYRFTSYCPHGRPATLDITEYDLEKWFKRVV